MLLLLSVLPGRGQDDSLHFDAAAQAWKNIRGTIQLIRQDRVSDLAGHVAYPLTRENPLADIRTRKQFGRAYDMLFDSTLKKALFRLKAEDIFEHDGNWSYGEGDGWFDPDGKINTINYSSLAERWRKDSLTAETYRRLYPGIGHWNRNVLVCKEGKRLIRVDEVGDSLRYIAWGAGKTISDKPDLVLSTAEQEIVVTGGSYTIAFSNAGDSRLSHKPFPKWRSTDPESLQTAMGLPIRTNVAIYVRAGKISLITTYSGPGHTRRRHHAGHCRHGIRLRRHPGAYLLPHLL